MQDHNTRSSHRQRSLSEAGGDLERRARLIQVALVPQVIAIRGPSITVRNARDGVDEFAGISCDYEVFFAEAEAYQPT